MRRLLTFFYFIATLFFVSILSACGGDGGETTASEFSIGGNVSGLANGAQVILQNKGTDALTLSANGAFVFTTLEPANGSYAVTVSKQPTGQVCSVSGGSGSGSGVSTDISTVNIACSTDSYIIGGTISGLASGAQVSLENNGANAITLSANGSFSFSAPIAYNGSYSVTMSGQPTGQICSVASGTGSGSGVTANISNVDIACSTNTYTIGGNVSGLASGAQVTLQNNGANALSLNANGPFTFSVPVAYNGSYAVTVSGQPTGQICSVSNTTGSGAGVSANVGNVSIVCSTDIYTIGGSVSGLASGAQVTLQNNGANALTLNANGPFTFTVPVAYNGSYTVTISGQPAGQICSVSGGTGSGVQVTANINSVSIICSMDTYTIGGSVSGLAAGAQVTLQNNGANTLTLNSNGPFAFTVPVAYNGSYAVTVSGQPAGQICSLSGGTGAGTGVTANINDVSITCGFSLTPISCCDGVFTSSNAGGGTSWMNSTQYPYMYFKLPSSMNTVSGQSIYVAITYANTGFGTISLAYDSLQSAYSAADIHAHSSFTNGGGISTMYVELTSPSLLHRENGGADLRISGPPFTILSITAQTTPFSDSGFQHALTTPWLNPITVRHGQLANTTTLVGSVMAGYQGWFRCPNDATDQGWGHWLTGDSFTSENFGVDQWPDLTAYPRSAWCRADALSTQSGQPAYVFSSTNIDVVEQHFSWMEQNNIDGVFLQRFLPAEPAAWTLANVRQAAADHGRIWAIEYDLSGLTDANVLQTVENDWKWLVDSAHILQDTSYAHEGVKPVVVLWGYSIRSGLTPTTGDQLVDFLKNDPVYGGNYVIGGVWAGWPTVVSTWQEHFTHYDGALVWQAQNFSNDNAFFKSLGVDYFADVFPGFSWSNLQKSNAGFSDRSGGQFYWNEMNAAVSAGSKRMFVGMFDEYNEGTAIMPMSDDSPVTQPYGHFVNNQGHASNWWLQLSNSGKSMMLGKTPVTNTMP